MYGTTVGATFSKSSFPAIKAGTYVFGQSVWADTQWCLPTQWLVLS